VPTARTGAADLREIDYLLMVNDEARQGALRFAERKGVRFWPSTALRRSRPDQLPRLLSAAEHVLSDTDTDDDCASASTGSSLGGARPKASVRDRDGHLAIASFRTRETN